MLANCVQQDTERTVMDKMDFSFHELVKGLCFALGFLPPPPPYIPEEQNEREPLLKGQLYPARSVFKPK